MQWLSCHARAVMSLFCFPTPDYVMWKDAECPLRSPLVSRLTRSPVHFGVWHGEYCPVVSCVCGQPVIVGRSFTGGQDASTPCYAWCLDVQGLARTHELARVPRDGLPCATAQLKPLTVRWRSMCLR